MLTHSYIGLYATDTHYTDTNVGPYETLTHSYIRLYVTDTQSNWPVQDRHRTAAHIHPGMYKTDTNPWTLALIFKTHMHMITLACEKQIQTYMQAMNPHTKDIPLHYAVQDSQTHTLDILPLFPFMLCKTDTTPHTKDLTHTYADLCKAQTHVLKTPKHILPLVHARQT